jgi:4-amino-4-deoxy-L-arabinose transferase-like glycosyltransferase
VLPAHGSTRAALATCALALAARLWLSANTPLVHDEYQWVRIADDVSWLPLGLPLHGDQHPPGAAWLAALGASLLGRNLLGYRLASALLGTALVLVARRLATDLVGPRAGNIAAVLVALNEYLVGVSRLATEKCYLAPALLSVILFQRAAAAPGPVRFAAAGASFGAALLIKQTPLVWLPLLGAWLLVRPARLRSGSFWLGIAVAALLTAPDVAWNVAAAGRADPGAEGFAWQISRLQPGLSIAPFALFVRPLFYLGSNPAVSEYASMTTGPGVLLLAGAVVSLWRLRTPAARALQALGFAPLCLFTVLGGGHGVEFWWADMVVVPFIALAAGVLAQLPRRRVVLFGVLAVALPGAIALFLQRDNCYPPWASPSLTEATARCEAVQRAFIVERRERDHVALTRLGPWRLPASSFYRDQLDRYASLLSRPDVAAGGLDVEGWPKVAAASVATERAWAESERARFDRP